MHDYSTSIAVSGTHGKTTTTSMVSLILDNAKKDPTILVGGNLNEFHGNVKIGKSDLFVTEACEYMDSFLSLRPKIEIILNIDSDHLDYFKDIDHIVASFDRFAKLVPKDGYIIAYAADPFVSRVIADADCHVITFGFSENADFYAANIEFNSEGHPLFDVCSKGQTLGRVQLEIPGEHNISNALASFATCYTLGVAPQDIIRTLRSFHGTQRRFDVLGTTKNNVTVIDDYAHHPTEIRATLKACREHSSRSSLVSLPASHLYEDSGSL